MSYKLKLGVAFVAVAALALPTLAAAQDPSTRTDIVVIGATLSDEATQVADTNAVATPNLPIVYEDEATTADEAKADESTNSAAAAAE